MANLFNQVRLYMEDNGQDFEDAVYKENVIVFYYDNKPSEITVWNVEGLAQPTQEQLDTLEDRANTWETNNIVRNTRRLSYGNIGEQLDEIFKDIDAWKARIKAIKDGNPKS
tara:strand:+ start:552 stop:887 length:336 start_codon:yes stop_codon:yes gene_type:complete